MKDPETISIDGFTGMSNVEDAAELFVKKGIARPRIALNVDVTSTGRVVRRDGYTRKIALAGAHSLANGLTTCFLVMSGTTIYRIDSGAAVSIGSIGGVTTRTWFEEVGNLVYLSNKSTNKIFDPSTNSLSAWGLAVPNGPVLTAITGGLDPGEYHVCLTTYDGSNNLSGNSSISSIVLSSTGGITVGNRAANTIVWCTDPNGDVFYRIGDTGIIVNVPTIEPLPTLFVSQPPFMNYITHAFGRMWGACGNKVYYSEAFHPDWFRLGTGYFEYATPVTMIARMRTGLFIGCEDRTYCMLGAEDGADPKQMQQLDVGAGAIPGTLAYCNNIIELGDTISPPEKKHVSVPVWVSQEGIVAGNPAGRIFNLSQGKVRFSPGSEGAALYRQRGGDFQYLTSFYSGPDNDSVGISDEATIEVMRNGVVI